MAKPEQGQSLGQNVFKVRIAVKSKGKGKSGGLRVITEEDEIYLLTIYDKSEMESIDNKTLKEMIKEINE